MVDSLNGPKIVVPHPGPKTKELMKRADAVSPRSSVRKKTGPTARKSMSCASSEGEGIYIIDYDGNVYMNFSSTTTIVGHNNPKIVAAVKKQLEKSGVSAIHGPSIPRIELMEKIKEIAPGELSEGKFLFCSTGSDATSFSMQLARAHTGKQLFIAYMGGHYGRGMGAQSLTTDRSENRRFFLPLVPGIVHVPYPYCYRCVFGQEYPDCNLRCLEHIQYVFDTVAHPDETAAFYIEPMMQVGGIVAPPKEYFPRLKDLCLENDILMVDDECATGFGKTGRMFGIEHWDVVPDIMYMAKGFANGISMAGMIARKDIMEKEAEQHAVAGQTFSGGLLSCVAALANIKEIQDRGLVKNSAEVGDHILTRLREMSEEHELIGDVRGKGLFIGIELVKDRISKKPAVDEAGRVMRAAFDRGLLVGRKGVYKQVISLYPPLILSKEESNKALEILEEAITEAEKSK